MCNYVTLAAIGQIPLYLALLVVTRDLMIVGAVMLCWVMGKPMLISPHVVSKANTAAQIAFVAALLGARAFGFSMPWFTAGVWLVAALTLASLAAYLRRWVAHVTAILPPGEGQADAHRVAGCVLAFDAGSRQPRPVHVRQCAGALHRGAGARLCARPRGRPVAEVGLNRLLATLVLVGVFVVVLAVVVLVLAPCWAGRWSVLRKACPSTPRGCRA